MHRTDKYSQSSWRNGGRKEEALKMCRKLCICKCEKVMVALFFNWLPLGVWALVTFSFNLMTVRIAFSKRNGNAFMEISNTEVYKTSLFSVLVIYLYMLVTLERIHLLVYHKCFYESEVVFPH